ncbi:MAG: GntR family transcriptional regulator, partial [Rhodobacterales bacterium CG_4_10_14_0_8_um_filter_70_9]
NEWLVREIPYSRAEHAFSAATPEQTERDLLRLGADEPVFVIERRTWLGAAPVTYVRLSHPGARYRMVSRLGDAAA